MLNFKLTYPVTVKDVYGNAIKQEMTTEFETKEEVISFLNGNYDGLTKEQCDNLWSITHPEEYQWNYSCDMMTLTIDGEEKKAERVGFITSANPGEYLDPGDTFDDVYRTLGKNGKEYVFCAVTNKWREYDESKDRKIWTEDEWRYKVAQAIKSVKIESADDIPFLL